jgi:hypothetical protein
LIDHAVSVEHFELGVGRGVDFEDGGEDGSWEDDDGDEEG